MIWFVLKTMFLAHAQIRLDIIFTEFLIIKMRIFTDTDCKQHCKQHEYQNMAPKNNPRGVSTLQKQELLQTRPQPPDLK